MRKTHYGSTTLTTYTITVLNILMTMLNAIESKNIEASYENQGNEECGNRRFP